jgi:tRNA (Thr-GGU) A37 N-methylase
VVSCPQPYRHSPATLGIFATRSPLRPNPVSMTTVAILKIEPEKGLIHLPYIDAEAGTPSSI